MTFIQHALTTAAAAAPANADPTAEGAAASAAAAASYGLELEQLVLHVLKNHQGPCDAAKADQGLAGRLHVLLYNHGVAKFEGKSFETAVEFFAASLDFAEVRFVVVGQRVRVRAYHRTRLQLVSSVCPRERHTHV